MKVLKKYLANINSNLVLQWFAHRNDIWSPRLSWFCTHPSISKCLSPIKANRSASRASANPNATFHASVNEIYPAADPQHHQFQNPSFRTPAPEPEVREGRNYYYCII